MRGGDVYACIATPVFPDRDVVGTNSTRASSSGSSDPTELVC